jgi:imidazolonepropionase-like amidohydrolase
MPMARVRLSAASLIDGGGAAAIQDATILLDGDRLAYAGPTRDAPAAHPDEETHAFPGCTILPGLIDAHVHLTLSSGRDPWVDQAQESDALLVLRAARAAETLLRAGITTVRDLGARNDTIFEFRSAVDRGIVKSPRLLVAGRPVTRSGGHTWMWNGQADGADQIRATIRKLFHQGADWIKLMATGGFANRGLEPYLPAYTDAEIAAAVDETHRLGRKITVLVTGLSGTWQEVRAGVDMVEHIPMMPGPSQWSFDHDLCREIRDRGIFVTATLAAG